MKKIILIFVLLVIAIFYGWSISDARVIVRPTIEGEGGGGGSIPPKNLRISPYSAEAIQPPANNPDTGNGPDSAGKVFLHNGEFYLNAVDLEIPSKGFPFRFQRFYRNQITYNGPLGNNWDHSYNIHLEQEKSEGVPTGNIFIVGGGRKDLYTNNLDNTYLPPAGLYNLLIKNPDNSFTLRDRHGMMHNFYPFDGSKIAGALKSISDRNNNTMRFTYNTYGVLSLVQDTAGRYILFYHYTGCNNNGRLFRIVDFTGRELWFTYSLTGDLIEVRSPKVSGTPNGNDFPDGKTTKYTYSSGYSDYNLNHNLLTITRPNETALEPDGAAVLSIEYNTYPGNYAFDKVIRENLDGGRISYFYEELGGSDYYNKTTVVDRVGNVTLYYHNPEGNRRQMTEYTGRTDPYNPEWPLPDPLPGRVRASDPHAFFTGYVYNSNGEITRYVYPNNEKLIQYVYDINNPDTYQRGNLLSKSIIRFPPEGEEDFLITDYTYEPIYNFIKTITNPRGYTTTNYYDYEEASLGDLNGDGKTNQAHGNLVMIEYPPITLGVETPPQIIQKKSTYNDNGLLLKEIEGEGNVSEFVYNPTTGYLLKSIAGSGSLNLTTEYTRNAVGDIIASKDPKGNVTTYIVNSLGQIVKTISPAPFNYEKLYYYNANDKLAQVDIQNKDKDNNIVSSNPWFTTTYAYNILDDLTSKTEEVDEAQTVTTQYQYNNNQDLTRIIYPELNSAYTTYDERDLIFQTANDVNTTSTRNYDTNKNLKTYIDGNNNTTTYNYDGFDRITEIIDPEGGKKTNAYDDSSNIIQTKFEGWLNDQKLSYVRLAQTNSLIDEINRAYQTDEAFFDPATQANYGDGARTTRDFYDKNSRLYKTLDDNNHATQYQYDAANRPTKTINAVGYQFENIYDNNSNVTQLLEQDIAGVTAYTKSYIHDNLNRITYFSDYLNHTDHYEYDSRNNITYLTDAKGNTSDYLYDGLKRLLISHYHLRQNGQGGNPIIKTITNAQAWDGNSRLISQTDDKINTTHYTYNAIDKLSNILFPDNTQITYTNYDANGNLTSFIDQLNRTFANYYNGLDSLTHRTVDGAPAEVFGYDGLLRLSSMQYPSPASYSVFSFDSLGNMRSENQDWGKIVSSDYDAEGNRTQVTYPNGRTIDYTHDALGRIDGIYEGGQQLFDYNYSFDMVQQRLATADYRLPQLDLSYDSGKRPTALTYHSYGTYDTVFQYGHDQENNRLYEQRTYTPWISKGDVFVPDSLYQLNTAKINVDDAAAESQNPGSGGNIEKTYDYALDGAGNRTFAEDGAYSMNGVIPPGDYQMNRYTDLISPSGNKYFQYDGAGDMTDNGTYKFSYDYRNLLTEVRDSVTNELIASYGYDAWGRRISKTVAGETTKFYYDGWRKIEDDQYGSAFKTYLYGNSMYEILGFTLGDVEPYYINQNPSGSSMYLTYGYNKIPLGIGHIAEIYEYDPFGKVKFFDPFYNPVPSSLNENSLLFHGMELDAETGLYYFFGRNYDPDIGRYLQKDTSGLWADPSNLGNGYTFAGNNPVGGFMQMASEENPAAENFSDETTSEGQLGLSSDIPSEENPEDSEVTEPAEPEETPLSDWMNYGGQIGTLPEQTPKMQSPTEEDWKKFVEQPYNGPLVSHGELELLGLGLDTLHLYKNPAGPATFLGYQYRGELGRIIPTWLGELRYGLNWGAKVLGWLALPLDCLNLCQIPGCNYVPTPPPDKPKPTPPPSSSIWTWGPQQPSDVKPTEPKPAIPPAQPPQKPAPQLAPAPPQEPKFPGWTGSGGQLGIGYGGM